VDEVGDDFNDDHKGEMYSVA